MTERSTSARHPAAMVQTDWLEAHLQNPALRIFDCTMHLLPAETDKEKPYRVVSSKVKYAQGHIPGAGFLDLHGDLSDSRSRFPFMLPPAEQFVTAMARYGIGEGTRVVLYSAGSPMWATRIWWMLRAFGFDQGGVLDGGWEKWRAENRPMSTGLEHYPPATFISRPRAGLFIGKKTVLKALADKETCLVNALRPYFHRGEGASRYGRPGRIPGSVNVPAVSLIDPKGTRSRPWKKLSLSSVPSAWIEVNGLSSIAAVAFLPPLTYFCSTNLAMNTLAFTTPL